MGQDMTKVTIDDQWEIAYVLSMVPKSTTLDDLEGPYLNLIRSDPVLVFVSRDFELGRKLRCDLRQTSSDLRLACRRSRPSVPHTG